MKLIIVLISILSIQQVPRAAAITHKMPDTAQIDTSRYAILTFNNNRDGFLFDKDFKPADISATEIRMIEKIIAVTAREYNKRKVNPIGNPRRYYKQIIAAINVKGEKEVWVNCFCTVAEKKYWHKGIVLVEDGGPCFFNLKINLNTNTVMKWAVNGVA